MLKVSRFSNLSRTNAAMRAYLRRVDERDVPLLPPALEAVLAPGLTLDGDALVLAIAREKVHPPPESFPDLTGYEAFVNHVHIDDHLDGGLASDSSALLTHGLAFTRRLEALLSREARPTELVLSVDEMSASVRFYTWRPDQPYLADDLEGYRDEAILVIDVRPGSG